MTEHHTPYTGSPAPSVFISHGSPMVALQDDAFTQALGHLSQTFLPPRAIVILSAHWVTPGPIQITAHPHPPTIYDFGGFPNELYQVEYPAPGMPALASKIALLLNNSSVEAVLNPDRGLDHGAWIPLRNLYPKADVPVIQISIPGTALGNPRLLIQLGNLLAPLRREGILLVGSGGAVHNLRKLRWNEKAAPPDSWAVDFEGWLKKCLEKADLESLLAFETAAPQAALAHPTHEHLLPAFFTIGTSLAGDRYKPIYEGIEYGNLSMFCFGLRPDHPSL